jgi:predicted thioesterase
MSDTILDAQHLGAAAERSVVVRDEDTAARWGSGGILVYATPNMIALMEGAAVDAVDPLLPAGYQTVGSLVNVRHLAATPVGRRVTARAVLTAIAGRKLTFRVEARDESGPIGEGEHERYIVDVARFMAKAAAR